MKKQFLAIAVIIAGLCSCSPSSKEPVVLDIEGGQITGVITETEGVTVYRGIPYAAAPVGELRWKAPQSVQPWEGIKVCDKFGNIAIQKLTDPGSFYDKEFFEDAEYVKDEDCLYLNVWTPAAGELDAKLPVAMWIHGGAYRNGYGHEKEMDGEAWAENGVILVTINYRLGVLGYMAHPELSAESPDGVSGNYGLMDQLAAIKWIRNNIGQFGGDPDKITIFGQSAGAGSVQSLVASPMVKGLIRGAIIQSGGGANPNAVDATLADAEKTGLGMMDFFGCKSIEEMRAIPAAEFNRMEDRIPEFVEKEGFSPRFAPNVDGFISTQNFSKAAYNNELADINYMIGGTVVDMRGNFSAVENFCTLREQQGKKAYAYQFARNLPGDDAGSFHSSELWYIFRTLSRCWRPFVEEDYQLSKYMVACWTNFAKYGNPNGEGEGEWTPYSTENPEFMIFKFDESGKSAPAMGRPLSPVAAN